MVIYTTYISRWNESLHAYVPDLTESVSYEYAGPVVECCGATPGQTAVGNAQSAAYTQMTQQASQVFGASSSVFQDLQNTFAPTVAAGPNQQGFSAGEVSNLNSQAITNVGNTYKNAKAALGDAQAAQNGGNVSLPGGATEGADLNLAEGAANQTASQLQQIQQADYAQGTTNYDTAVAGLAGAPNAFNASTSAGSAATGSGTAAANTQNQIATQDNSWVGALTGALGSVAGSALTGGLSNLGKGLSFFGGSGSPQGQGYQSATNAVNQSQAAEGTVQPISTPYQGTISELYQGAGS